MNRATRIDLTMDVMLAIAPGVPWPLNAIADVTGLTKQAVQQCEKYALRKLVNKLQRAGICRASDARLMRINRSK